MKPLVNILDLVQDGYIEPLQDNSNFKKYLKKFESAFFYDFDTASADEHRTFFYNLGYAAEKDLSFAHCIMTNQSARLSIELGPSEFAKNILNSHSYSDLVCSYSDHRKLDTIKFDSVTNMLTPGIKGWLTNLLSADVCVIRVPDTETKNKHDVFLDLRNINHYKSSGPPFSFGMKGAAPGVLTLPDAVPVDTDFCRILKTNPGLDPVYKLPIYVRRCWTAVHLGIILGLYKDLLKNDELKDPILTYRLKNLELEISSLKMLWEQELQNIIPVEPVELAYATNKDKSNKLETTTHWQAYSTQYALSKKILLDIITLVLEVGLHYYVDESTCEHIKFKDAVTYVTHMHPLLKCFQKPFPPNSIWY